MTACYYSIYCDLIHNGDAKTQNKENSISKQFRIMWFQRIARETAIHCNPTVHRFTQGRKNFTDLLVCYIFKKIEGEAIFC
jgi:hypothetical protein